MSGNVPWVVSVVDKWWRRNLCRGTFAESESGPKPPTVDRIGARARPVSSRSLPKWYGRG